MSVGLEERDSSSDALLDVSSIFFHLLKVFFFFKYGRFSSLGLNGGNGILILGRNT